MGGVVIVIVGVLMINYFKSINRVEDIGSGEEASIQIVEGEKPDNLPTTYIVKKGDNLWRIAEKFYKSGYNFVDIVAANQIADADQIEVGTELTIPQVEVKKLTVLTEINKAVITIEGDSYITVANDSLWNIAVRAYGDGYAWPQIYEANKTDIGINPNLIAKGMTLAIPR